MRLYTQLVFDAFVRGTTEVFSSPEFHDLLGKAHDIVYEIEVEEAGGSDTPTITVKHQWSNSGKAFLDATTLTGPTVFTTLPIRVIVTKSGPMAAQGRVSVVLAGTTPTARVRVWATGWSA